MSLPVKMRFLKGDTIIGIASANYGWFYSDDILFRTITEAMEEIECLREGVNWDAVWLYEKIVTRRDLHARWVGDISDEEFVARIRESSYNELKTFKEDLPQT
jgi:hypothetical protein